MRNECPHVSLSPLRGIIAGLCVFVLIWAVFTPALAIRPEAQDSAVSLSHSLLLDSYRAVAELEHAHLNWPTDNKVPKLSFREYISDDVLMKRAEEPLRMSAALEDIYEDPITPDQLQAELEREATATKQPERLRELWASLGNDPALIAEVIARPILAENRLREHYSADEWFHGDLRQQIRKEISGLTGPLQLKTLSGSYHETEYRFVEEGELINRATDSEREGIVNISPQRWSSYLHWIGKNVARGDVLRTSELTDAIGKFQESTDHYYLKAVVKVWDNAVRVGTMTWKKPSFSLWWETVRNDYPTTNVALATMGSYPYSLPVISSKTRSAPEEWCHSSR